MVGQDENWDVKWRVVTPPPLPCIVGPRSSDWAEHVSTHDPRSNIHYTARREIVIDPCRPAPAPVHLSKRTRCDEPIMERLTSNTEGVVWALVGTGGVTVERNGDVVNTKFGHRLILFSLAPLFDPKARGQASR
jgi:hypothetical protein